MPDATTPPIQRALISVYDKTGLVDFGRALADMGVHILSTGGSARMLADAGIPVTEVSDHTGFPEMLDGRVKTLHPKIHGGLLGLRDNREHGKTMASHGIAPIDLLVCNLYPFEETLASGAEFDDCIEQIDIGGPAMTRSASKNHRSVTVISDPEDYNLVLAEMKANKGGTTAATRRRLAAKAFTRTAAYDAAISAWLTTQTEEDSAFPQVLSVSGNLQQTLRYGENPHQSAALYAGPEKRPGVVTATQLQGKELSFNNINDTDAAYELVAEFGEPAVAIIKHANPCGVAVASETREAYRRALACDPVSAFGGIIALNRPLFADTAEEIAKLFAEVVIAPEINEAALKILSAKKNVRVLQAGGLPDPAAPGMTIRTVAGGYLLQGRDNGRVAEADLRVVTKRAPDSREMRDLLIAFRICKHVKSNAIVYVKDGATVGVGAGQMSRVDSARIAVIKSSDAAAAAGEAGRRTDGCVVASDAFFPFADGLMAAVDAGATAVIQPGGSMRDDEVIAAADEAGIAMVMTGMRHFRH
ncbi:MAG: bifunctional phosphoribosylaminoimidazolecarboxamide formyltransferase/IMP cyclohydrolase [Rhodospirillales bacterium]